MEVPPSAEMEWRAEAAAHTALAEMGWPWRDQPKADFGIDCHTEVVDDDKRITGKLIALQLKGGTSFFRERTSSEWWVFRGDVKHLEYWLGHVLPVIVVIFDPDTHRAYWQVVNEQTVRRTPNGFVLPIPPSQPFDVHAKESLSAVAGRRDETALARFEHHRTLVSADVSESLSQAAKGDPLAAALLADMLAEGREQPGLTVTAVLNSDPQWLTETPSTAWLFAAIGAYASSHELPALAGDAFERSAQHDDERAGRRHAIVGFCRMESGETAAARTAFERARETGADLLGLAGLTALDHGTDDASPLALPPELADADRSEIAGDPMLLNFIAEQRAREERLDDGISLLEEGVEMYPRAGGLRLALAQHLGRRVAMLGERPGVSLRRARDHAAIVLADRRRWSGPTVGPLDLIIGFMLADGDATAALTAASMAPDGTATDAEAQRPSIALRGALAAVLLDDREDVDRFVAILGDSQQALQFAAMRADLEGSEDESRAAWKALLRVATDDDVRTRCVSRLATLGVWPLPEAEDLRQRHIIADLLYQVFGARALARSNLQKAVTDLRALASGTLLAALALVEVLEAAGRIDEALAECERQARHWQATPLTVKWADLLRGHGHDEQGADLLERALARADLSPDMQHSFRRSLIQFYGRRGEWTRVADLAEVVLRDHSSDDTVAWNRVVALWNLRRVDDARREASGYELHPTSNEEVRLWAQLHLGVAWSDEDIAQAIALAEAYHDDRPLSASLLALAAREAFAPGTPASAETIAQVHEVLDRLGEDEAVLRSLSGNVDEVLADLTSELRAQHVGTADLVDRVRAGRAAVGELAASMKRPYGQALLQRAVGFTPACEPSRLDDEIAAAEGSLGQPWVVEASSLYVSDLLPGVGATLRALSGVLRTTAHCVDDAVRTRDAVRALTSASYSVVYDPETDSLKQSQLSAEQRAVLRYRAERLEGLLADCEVHTLPIGSATALADAAWSSSIALADSHGLPLYSDDIVVRRLARQRGIKTFGTVALLHIAAREGLMPDGAGDTDAGSNAALRALLSEYVVDLPVSAIDITDQAEADSWQLGPASTVLARSAWWSGSDAFDNWYFIAQRAASASEEAATRLIAVALHGALAASQLGQHVEVALKVIGTALAGAYASGISGASRLISSLSPVTVLEGIPDRETRTFLAVREALTGRVPDAGTAAAEIMRVTAL